MKKVAIISTAYIPNIWNNHGRATFSLALGLSKSCDVTVFTYSDTGTTVAKQEGQVLVWYVGLPNVKNSTLPFEHIKAWNVAIHKLIQGKVYDTWICNSWHGWEVAKQQLSKKVAIIPLLYNFTGWLKPLGTKLEEEITGIELDCLLNSDVVVSHTEKYGLKLAGYANRDITVIANSSTEDTDLIPSCTKVKNQICFIGKVSREKCLERILRIMPELGNIELVVAYPDTSNTYVASLLALARSLDIEHRIKFLGWMPTANAKNLYACSSLCIVPSNFEAYGYAALDPMAIGTQVLVSEWSTLDAYVGDSFSSLAALKEKVAYLLSMSDEAKLRDILKNKNRVAMHYSESYITSQYEHII